MDNYKKDVEEIEVISRQKWLNFCTQMIGG